MTTIRHQAQIRGDVRRVYEALTTTAGIQGWWARNCTLTDRIGGEHELKFDKGGQIVAMRFRVDALEPDRRVAWTCTANGNPVWVGTTLAFVLGAGGEHVTVDFEHAGFREDQSPPYQATVQGWQHFIKSLVAWCETGRGEPWG